MAIAVADTTAYMLAGSYKISQFRLRGGYERMNFTNPSNPGMEAGIDNVMGYTVSAINTSPFTAAKHLQAI